jgi:class 3 adenylate cyclase/tetratricopeptide (TPR) repeat protein
MAICPACGQENPEGAKFCNECAAPLGEALPAREQRKVVTVLFCDLIGSTELGETLDPEPLRALLATYFERMKGIVEHHGGTVEKFIGDAVMAVFGLPVLHEDDALRAVRAAVEMRDAFPELGIEGRIGVTTGEVVTGTEERLATGDPVNVAARLEQAARPGEILISEETLRFIRDAVEIEEVPALALKGKAVRVSAFRLVALRPGEGFARRLDAPMVGRSTELRRLHDAFEQAVRDRSCQLFTVLGLAGVGKSRLVQEFLADLAGRALVARGRCLPYGEGITYWPLLEAVKEGVGLDDADSPDEARTKLISILADAQNAEFSARRVAELVGLAETAGRAEEGFAAARALFEGLARARPLLLIFDDIHWGEAMFLDLVEHVADWARDAPILLVCLARPELLDVRPGWAGGKLNATTALLEPLSRVESAQLIDNLAGRRVLGEGARRRIVEAAEGNPLFVEEMLALVIEDGRAGGDLQVPATIQALLAARIDSLGADERAVLELASVEGNVFYEEAVAELAPDALRPAATESLGSLLRKELIRPDRPALGCRTYRFRHLLIRDAAYDSIPKKARAQMHERFGRWLERAAGERATEYEEVVGYHFEQAYRYRVELGPSDDAARLIAREAAERLGAAGRRAFVRSDAPAGVNLISRAANLLPPADPLRVDLIPNVRVVQGMGGDMGWADRVLTEAVEAAEEAGDRRRVAHALVQRGLLRLFTEPEVTAVELIEVGERAIAVFEEHGDELGLARAWRLVAQAHYLDRHLRACVEASEHALEHARRAADRFEEREIVEWLVVALFLGPVPADEAAGRCERLLEESGGDPALEVQILGALAVLTAMQRRVDEVHEFISRGQQAVDKLGEWVWLFSYHRAQVALWQGNPAAAEAALRPPYEALKKIGEKSHFSAMVQYLAIAVYAQGRYEEAEQLIRECEEAARPNDVAAQIMLRATRAKLLARRGEFQAAERLASEAVAFAEESDFLLDRGDALMDLAEVLELAGAHEPAAAAVREAIGLFERKGNVVLADQGRARLAVLGVP